MVFIAIGIFVSCTDDNSRPAELVGLSIKTAPSRINFFIGEALDLSGMEVTSALSDGSTEIVPFEKLDMGSFEFIPNNGTILDAGVKEVKLFHLESGISASQIINVAEVVVESISLKSLPAKVNYIEGEVLDLTGLAVSLLMSNGTSRDIALSEFMTESIVCSAYSGITLTPMHSFVTITHVPSGVGVILPIVVNKIAVVELSLKTLPLKAKYYERDALDLEGLVVVIKKNNGETIDVPFSEFNAKGITCAPANGTILKMGDTQVALNYMNSGITVSLIIEVVENKCVGVVVKTPPTKSRFIIGDRLQLDGLVVELTWENGKVENVTVSDFQQIGLIVMPANGDVLDNFLANLTITEAKSGLSASLKVVVYELLTDIEGNRYPIVQIGTQKWMAADLRTSRYSNGDYIGTTSSASLDISAEQSPKYQWAYNGNNDYVDTYGRLYTWHVAVDSRNVCPSGWHVPTNDEWALVRDFLGGNSFAGGKLREEGTVHWFAPNTGATNESGFSGLPSGERGVKGVFSNLKSSATWWTSIEYPSLPTKAYCFYTDYSNAKVYTLNYFKSQGLSIRCVKD